VGVLVKMNHHVTAKYGFVLLGVLCVVPVAAFGQQQCRSLNLPLLECWAQITIYSGEGGPPPASQCDCNGLPESFTNCYLRNNRCAPPNECPTCHDASNPVDLATGDTFITQTDISVPGLGGGINLTRTWNSVLFEGVEVLGMFGTGWTSTYEDKVFPGGDGFMKYMRPDGGIWSFAYTGGGGSNASYMVAGPANKTATLAETTSNNVVTWTLTFQNGEKRTYDLNSGKLLSISDRNGNTTTLSYDASYRLTTVTDPAGRHLYFTYGNFTYSNLTGVGGAFLVTNVSSDFGVSLSYAYDSMGT
jgi:YD repeat-containing protein